MRVVLVFRVRVLIVLPSGLVAMLAFVFAQMIIAHVLV
jgi:hypothetical protein